MNKKTGVKCGIRYVSKYVVIKLMRERKEIFFVSLQQSTCYLLEKMRRSPKVEKKNGKSSHLIFHIINLTMPVVNLINGMENHYRKRNVSFF